MRMQTQPILVQTSTPLDARLTTTAYRFFPPVAFFPFLVVATGVALALSLSAGVLLLTLLALAGFTSGIGSSSACTLLACAKNILASRSDMFSM